MTTTICKQFRVEGLVQGVFYRATTQTKARELGLTGFARNERDGSVTVMACGDSVAIASLQKWLWEGPTMSKVSQVVEQDCDNETFSDFTTL